MLTTGLNPIATDADTKLPKHMAEQCLDVKYAAKNYGACCGKGGYKVKGRKEVCRKAKVLLKTRKKDEV